jgi:hypothetical protein
MNTPIPRILMIMATLLISAQFAHAQDSGFIDNPPQLTQDPDRSGAMTWQKPDLDRSAYKSVMIAPIEIFVSPDSDYKGLNADQMKALSDGFRQTLGQALNPDIAVVDEAGPGVLLIHAAITNVKLKKKKRGLLGYTPVGIVVTAAKDAAGARVSLKDATLEFELLDASTEERVAVLIDKAPVTAPEEELSWESVEKTFQVYAERYKARMH